MKINELEKLLSEMSDETLSLAGSILNIEGAGKMRRIQEEFVAKHPHHIPLLLMYDVINGMETIIARSGRIVASCYDGMDARYRGRKRNCRRTIR